jgi:hypothetical protein
MLCVILKSPWQIFLLPCPLSNAHKPEHQHILELTIWMEDGI